MNAECETQSDDEDDDSDVSIFLSALCSRECKDVCDEEVTKPGNEGFNIFVMQSNWY